MFTFGCVIALVLVGQGNLLRNGTFQDDWQTHLPELKNHHWNYTTEVFNRRDYNPDGWALSGKWQWLDADKPRGQRRLVLSSPSKVGQRVNWVTIHNSAKLSGWPDAGGYPTAEAVRVKNGFTMVGGITLRVWLSGKDVPMGGATITVAWSGASPVDGPMPEKHVSSASIAVPPGTYENQTVEVTLPAHKWMAEAQKDPAFKAQGALVPMAAVAEIAYADKSKGSVEVHEAILDPGPKYASNLLANGDFEQTKDGWPVNWSRPRKYRYFPPGVYYIFNTWHNSNSDNRGSVRPDELVRYRGRYSLRMTVPTGDEVCVVSDPITLNQKEAKLIEVRAYVKTHQLCMMQIEAEDETGKRLDGFNFIHKAPLSIGTEDWRQVRQVFRPAKPLKSVRLKLCARGMNGYTLGGTGHQPQQNAAGIIWWDNVGVYEPESTADELRNRGLTMHPAMPGKEKPHLAKLDLGEQKLGENELSAEIVNPVGDGEYAVRLSWPGYPKRTVTSKPVRVGLKPVPVKLSYTLDRVGHAYGEETANLEVIKVVAGKVTVASANDFPVATWTVPIDLELGALYLRPTQKQFVRVNLGLSHAEMAGGIL